MVDVKIKVEGLSELEKQLNVMGQELAAKSIVSAAFNANKIVQDTAKQNLISAGAYDTGALYRSISRKRIIYDQTGTVVIVTGVNSKVKEVDANGNVRWPVKYAHLVEKQKPFMREAYEKTNSTVVDRFKTFLKNKIDTFTR
jgi:hypothetical protein